MGKRIKREGEPEEGAPEWMCTFSDMMSLLLCFFILLFAMSNLETKKFQQAIASIQGALGRIPTLYTTSFTKPASTTPQTSEPMQRNKTVERAKEAIAEKARSRLNADEKTQEISVEGVKEGIRFTLSGRMLFQPGLAILTPEGKTILNGVALTLSEFPKLRVRIEGHTDSSPLPANSVFADNWKLAEARSMTVMDFLRDEAEPVDNRIQEKRFIIMSCSNNRSRFPNDTIESRALNRRVEIVLLQGSHSESIAGVLEAKGDSKINPNEKDYAPKP